MDKHDLIKPENTLDLYIISRYMYKIGHPILKDKGYDAISNKIKTDYKNTEDLAIKKLINTTYDEDVFPKEVFSKYGMSIPTKVLKEMNAVKITDNPKYQEIKSRINEFRTHSIKPTESYEDAWEWFKHRLSKDIVLSLKVNGINTRSFINIKEDKTSDDTGVINSLTTNINETEFELLCSSTRARTGDGFDITKNLSRKFPNKIVLPNESKGDIEDIKVVYGEAYVTKGSLELLRNKYHNEATWKTARSTALSVLRVDILPEDYEHMKLKVFKISDIANTLNETLSIAKKAGFDVVPWKVIKANSIPNNFEEFSLWLTINLAEFAEISEREDIESDGVVAEVDNQVDFAMEGSMNQYNTGNIALKIDKWSSVGYVGKVKRIIVEPQREKYSVKVEIQPVVMSNGNVATTVNCFNPDIVIKEGIKPGSFINFEYKSDANINLIRTHSL